MRKSPTSGLDSTDLKILDCLQTDASQSLAAIAEQVHLSMNACWHRVRRMEESGVILKRVALINASKVGAGVTMFVMIRAPEHTQEWFENFAATVCAIPGITEFYRTGGEVDYLLKLQLADISSYDEIYKVLIRSARCADVSAAFAMEEIKRTTAVPLAL